MASSSPEFGAVSGAAVEQVFDRFHPATRAWFSAAFATPTPAQVGAWEAVARGEHALVVAPTGSGKTLAAFMSGIDAILTQQPPSERQHRCRVLYISPLKALAVDVERNLTAPLVGIQHAAQRLDLPVNPVSVSTRTGDTSAADRRRFMTSPGDILITTPESLFLLLTSQARESLRGVHTVIVDEIHALAGTKRGAHLALSLERLDELLERPAQRIGLSATVRPIDDVAQFLVGAGSSATIVAPPSTKTFELSVVVPVDDMSDLSEQVDRDGNAARSVWPAVEESIYDLVRAHHSTIVFANARRAAERLTARLNERAAVDRVLPTTGTTMGPAHVAGASGQAVHDDDYILARAHHGSVSREQRLIAEEALKNGSLPAVVATSSLELGIDMGAVDLVVQVESPPSVAAGLQRVGRAGHHVGAPSKGVFFPKHRGDLVSTAVVVDRMYTGELEPLRMPSNPLDVLAQQIVALVADQPYSVDRLFEVVRRAAPYRTLPESLFHGVLDMLAGRYPSDRFGSLKPRIVWDRVSNTVHGRPGAARVAVTSGGTIPDRGLFGVFIIGDERGGRRVGELDEEMVYESRVGDVFLLGTSSWRIVEITHDRVLVAPAPGVPARMPFWKGESLGRPFPLGQAIGEFIRAVAQGQEPRALQSLDARAAANLRAYVAAQAEATGVVPHDRQVLIERFRDELGDWRIIVHSPFGAQVNAPWALIVGARLKQTYGTDAQAMHGDDGIVLRVPDTTGVPPGLDLLLIEPDEVEALVTDQLMGSPLFASRFRECASRSLLLPRRNPGKRSPLWQQRQRAAQLLEVATEFGDFPIVLETLRECLQDVYDVPGLVTVLSAIRDRTITISEVETATASPFAQSLLFGYIAQFLYQEDVPLAERRMSALSLDVSLLRELLGSAELRELIDPEAVRAIAESLQRLTAERAIRDVEDLADALRDLGDLTREQVAARGGAAQWCDELIAQRRALEVRIAGEDRLIAIEDAGRYTDALGVTLPVGVPEAFTEPTSAPWQAIVRRYARTQPPFKPADLAQRYCVGEALVREVLAELAAAGELTRGEFTPGASGIEWCDVEVLRRIRRTSLARSRAEVEPVSHESYTRFLAHWQGVGTGRHRGADGVFAVVEQLAGAAIGATAWESLVLPSRVDGYEPALLDALLTAGEVMWVGAGGHGTDGYIRIVPSDLSLVLPPAEPASGDVECAVLQTITDGGAMFFRDIMQRLRERDALTPEAELIDAVWSLAWKGQLTNDSFAAVRARNGTHRSPRGATRRSRHGRSRLRLAPPSPPAAAGRWSVVVRDDGDGLATAHLCDVLAERYGVLTRGPVQAEDVDGGFGRLYPALSAYEDAGRLRRGYFVDGLGAAQFAVTGAIEVLRGARQRGDAVVFAATDPAQPFGAALPWPRSGYGEELSAAHRPGRKAGALVVIDDGQPGLYVERGGKSLITLSADSDVLARSATALAAAVRAGRVPTLHVQRVNGSALDRQSPIAAALSAAGFSGSPRGGLRLRNET